MRVLHLSTYPVAVPRHGGQARVANLARVYEAAGIESRVIAVYEPEHYGGALLGPHDVPFPWDSPHRDTGLPFCTDLASGEYAAGDPSAWGRLQREVTVFRPEVIQLEQPWLWPFLRRLRAERAAPPFKVVYSSQNLEAPLKARMLEGQPPALVDRVVARIEALERELAAAADLTVAVTAADAEVYRAWGARRVVVAPNGVVERAVDPERVRDWEARLRGRRFALFVGSAYPPNVRGFWEMFAPSLAFLAPDERVVVVGGIGSIVMDAPSARVWERLNASRLECVGMQEEADLAALLALAACVVLPITIGGGSNIKTAEAILSGRPVVGTTTSFRGYEALASLPGLHQTDDPAEFRRLVRQALDRPAAPADRTEARRRVLWTHTLGNLPADLAAL